MVSFVALTPIIPVAYRLINGDANIPAGVPPSLPEVSEADSGDSKKSISFADTIFL